MKAASTQITDKSGYKSSFYWICYLSKRMPLFGKNNMTSTYKTTGVHVFFIYQPRFSYCLCKVRTKHVKRIAGPQYSFGTWVCKTLHDWFYYIKSAPNLMVLHRQIKTSITKTPACPTCLKSWFHWIPDIENNIDSVFSANIF